MLWVAIFGALALVGFAYNSKNVAYPSDWPLILAIASTIAGAMCVIGTVICLLQAPADMAVIAALRSAAGVVSPVSAHDIYGQASEMNQTIAANRYYRSRWWSRSFVPAQWDTVQSITLPGSR